MILHARDAEPPPPPHLEDGLGSEMPAARLQQHGESREARAERPAEERLVEHEQSASLQMAIAAPRPPGGGTRQPAPPAEAQREEEHAGRSFGELRGPLCSPITPSKQCRAARHRGILREGSCVQGERFRDRRVTHDRRRGGGSRSGRNERSTQRNRRRQAGFGLGAPSQQILRHTSKGSCLFCF